MNRTLLAALALAAACGGTETPIDLAAAAFIDEPAMKGTAARLVADASGRLHAAWFEPSFDASARGVWYATCASGCERAAAWSPVRVGVAGTDGGGADLVVDASGKVRVVWVQKTASVAAFATAACDANCAAAEGWGAQQELWATTVVPLSTGYLAAGPDGALGLAWRDDASGHAGLFYSACTADCGAAASWSETALPSSDSLTEPRLAADPTGRPRLLAADSSTGGVAYLACDATCAASAASWTAPTQLYGLGAGGSYALRVDADGHPRVALYQGDVGASAPGGFLYFAWCDAACGLAAGSAGSGWGARTIGLPQQYGANGIDLALGAGGKVRVAYAWYPDGTGVGLATCSANCTSQTPNWSAASLESATQLAAAAPRALPAGYDGTTWITVGRAPSLALDAAGTPWVASGAEHARWRRSELPAYLIDELRLRVVRPSP